MHGTVVEVKMAVVPVQLAFFRDKRMKIATTTLILDYVPAPFKNVNGGFIRTGKAILMTCFLNAGSFIGSAYVRKGVTLLIGTELSIHDKPPAADTSGETYPTHAKPRHSKFWKHYGKIHRTM